MSKYNVFGYILSICLLASCSTKQDSKPILSVSIEPQKYFLEQLVGDKYSVHCVIPNGSNPESFDPAPSQMVSLGKSSLYFKVGFLGFENSWMDNIQKNNPKLQIIDCSTSIQTEECQGEDHDHEHTHDHSHDGPDPHIWSSPKTAQIMAENMYKALLLNDPDNTEFYKSNFETLSNEFHQTDSIIRVYIEKAPSRDFIIYHPALSYFAREYGLHQHSIEFEGKNPSPTQMKQMIDLVKKENVKVVFVQEEFDKKNAETVAQEIGAKIVPINLLSYNWSAEMIKIAKALAFEE